jgi:hypothetical protein
VTQWIAGGLIAAAVVGGVADGISQDVSVDHIRDDGSGETVYPDHYFRDPARDAYDYAVTDAAGQESAAAWLVSHRGYTQERALAETETAAHYDLTLLREDAAHAGISEQEA